MAYDQYLEVLANQKLKTSYSTFNPLNNRPSFGPLTGFYYAIENLQEYFLKQPMEMAVAANEDETPSMLMPATADSYNSSRLLSHAFQGKLREFVGGDLVIGVPGRDFFVAVSMKADVMIDHIRERVREDYVHTDHPLTDRLLLISADGVSELHDE